MSTSSQEILKSFDLLPEPEQREVAFAIARRASALYRKPDLNDEQLEALYSEFAAEDRRLAQEGLEDYQRGLVAEDAR